MQMCRGGQRPGNTLRGWSSTSHWALQVPSDSALWGRAGIPTASGEEKLRQGERRKGEEMGGKRETDRGWTEVRAPHGPGGAGAQGRPGPVSRGEHSPAEKA